MLRTEWTQRHLYSKGNTGKTELEKLRKKELKEERQNQGLMRLEDILKS